MLISIPFQPLSNPISIAKNQPFLRFSSHMFPVQSRLKSTPQVVREAAQLAVQAAALPSDAASGSDAGSARSEGRWSWELISEATTTEAEPEELEPLIPLAG